jgi:hypothetical protein
VNKSEKEQKQVLIERWSAQIEEWRAQIEDWREQIKCLGAALEVDIAERRMKILNIGPPALFKLKLRPWIGYEETGDIDVDVDNVATLVEAARQVVGADANQVIKLFYCELKDGLPINKDYRKTVNSPADVEPAQKEAESVIWICVGGSPSTDPQKRKPFSPFLVKERVVEFRNLPELFEDSAFKEVCGALRSGELDPRLVFLLFLAQARLALFSLLAKVQRSNMFG